MITIYNSIKSAITSINLPRKGLHVYNTYNAMQSIMVPKGFRDFSDTSLITSNLKEATLIRSYTGRLPSQSGLMGLTNHHSSSYSGNYGADSGYIQYFRGPALGAPRNFPSSTQQNTHCVKNTYELVHERNLGVTWRFMLAEVVEIPSTIS